MTWVFVPGLHSAPAGEDSNSGLASWYRDTAPSLGLNGMPVQPATLSRAWKTKPYMRRLSGLTCEPSTAQRGVDAWISSLRGFPVSRFPSPAADEAQTIPGISGRTSRGSLARLAASGRSSRTFPVSSQPSLLMDEQPSPSSSMDYASWATNARRESSQRRRLARHTFANGSSSWPTPCADDEGRTEVSASNRIRRGNQNDLSTSVALWPTLRSEDSESTGQHGAAVDTLTSAMRMWPIPDGGIRTGFNRSVGEGAALRPLLAEAAEMWATPSAHDGRRPGSDETSTQGANLKREAEMWPTPDGGVRTGFNRSQSEGAAARPLLAEAVEMWPTPSANEDAAGTVDGKMQFMLTHAAKLFPSSLPDATSTSDGEPSSPSAPTSPRRLNPAFVEWLMGWPLGWTDLDSPFSATELSLWSRRMRSSLCALGWEG